MSEEISIEDWLKKHPRVRNGALLIMTAFLISGAALVMAGQKEYLTIQYNVSREIYANTNDNSLILCDTESVRYLMEPFGERRVLNTEFYTDECTGMCSDESIHTFIGNDTYIVRKDFGSFEDWNSPAMWNLSMRTKRIINETGAVLVRNISYPESGTIFKSRPFNLEIWRVPYDG